MTPDFDANIFLDLVDDAADMVQSVSPDGRFLYVNRAWLVTLGYSPGEVKDLTIFDIVSPACREICMEKFRTVLSSHQAHRVDAEFLARDGRLIPVEGMVRTQFREGVSFATIGIFRDITDRIRAERERRRIEEHARTTELLEAINRLAGGFAHHFNNLLMAVQGNIDLAKRYVRNSPKVLRHLDEAEKSISYAARFSREILSFANMDGQRKWIQLVELDSTVASMIEILRGLVPRSISMQHESIGPPSTIPADPQGLRTLFFHLVLNAREAIGDREGRITVRTGRMPAQGAYDQEGHFFGILEEKDYALLEVEDNGAGMSPDVIQHIFEPFYSTKNPSRQGIGLSSAYRFIMDMDGAVSVTSSPGAGTVIRVFFPMRTVPKPHANSFNINTT